MGNMPAKDLQMLGTIHTQSLDGLESTVPHSENDRHMKQSPANDCTGLMSLYRCRSRNCHANTPLYVTIEVLKMDRAPWHVVAKKSAKRVSWASCCLVVSRLSSW